MYRTVDPLLDRDERNYVFTTAIGMNFNDIELSMMFDKLPFC